VVKGKPTSLLKRWIFVGFMQIHLPILHAALLHFINSRKLPVKYEEDAKVLCYILTSTLNEIENGVDHDPR
jgi:hypothetical protein